MSSVPPLVAAGIGCSDDSCVWSALVRLPVSLWRTLQLLLLRLRRYSVRNLYAAALATLVAVMVPLRGSCESPQRDEHFRSGTSTPSHTHSPRTDVEQRASVQISQGEEVRLSGECPDWRATDKQLGNDVDSSRYTLGGRFIAEILTDPPFGASSAASSIVIRGARIAGDIVVESGTTPVPVTIACSTVEGNIRFQDWRALGGVEFSRVRVTGSLKFHDVDAQSLVALTESDVGRVEVNRSRFARDLSFRATQLRTELKIASTRVEGSLLMGCHVLSEESHCASYGLTRFLNLHVSDAFDLIGSRFVDEVTFQELHLGGSLQAAQVEFQSTLTVSGGEFDGTFRMPSSIVHGPLIVEDTNLQGGIDLHGGTYDSIAIRHADINRYVDMNASTFRSLDLGGTTVRGELRIGAPNETINRDAPGDDIHFSARNVRVESLQDTPESWPVGLNWELDGFEYDKLSGSSESGASAYLRGSDWFKEWLAGDETYSPQPYRHLSELLRREGQREAANDILYAAKERERAELPLTDWYRWWLELLRVSVGYGIGLRAFLALGWMLLLCLFGWLIAMYTTRGCGVSRWTLLWYSVSYTVPAFNLAAADQVTVPRCANNWFYVQRLACYALAMLAGAAAVGLVQPE